MDIHPRITFSLPTPLRSQNLGDWSSLRYLCSIAPGIDFKNCDRCPQSFHTVFEAGVTLFQQIVAGQIRGWEGLSHCPSICGKKTVIESWLVLVTEKFIFWGFLWRKFSTMNPIFEKTKLVLGTCVFEREWMCTFPSFCFSPGNGPTKKTYKNHVANFTHTRWFPQLHIPKKTLSFPIPKNAPANLPKTQTGARFQGDSWGQISIPLIDLAPWFCWCRVEIRELGLDVGARGVKIVDPTGGFWLVETQLGVEGCVFERGWMLGCFFVDVCWVLTSHYEKTNL